MADQNFMDLASKTASGMGGTDYMMLVNNSEAYKALVNDVAEAILGKLTSKRFSGLETTEKNVIGALNELNSKSIFNTIGTDIPRNENLNNYTSPGTYACQNTSVAATLSGIPSDVTTGFRLDVIRKTNGRAMQILFPNEPDIFYIRGFTTDSSNFGPWKKFSGVSS